MTALRVYSSLTLRRAPIRFCGHRGTTSVRLGTFGSPSVAARKTNVLSAPWTNSSGWFTVSHFQRGTIIAGNSLTKQQAVAMPVTLDHSSFANYRQAAVTHIDLGKLTRGCTCSFFANYDQYVLMPMLLLADLSVHFDSKTVGGTAKVHAYCLDVYAYGGKLLSHETTIACAAVCQHQRERNVRSLPRHPRLDHQQCY